MMQLRIALQHIYLKQCLQKKVACVLSKYICFILPGTDLISASALEFATAYLKQAL